MQDDVWGSFRTFGVFGRSGFKYLVFNFWTYGVFGHSGFGRSGFGRSGFGRSGFSLPFLGTDMNPEPRTPNV